MGSRASEKNKSGKKPIDLVTDNNKKRLNLLSLPESTLLLVTLRKLKQEFNKIDINESEVWKEFKQTAPENVLLQYLALDEEAPRYAVYSFNRAREAERERAEDEAKAAAEMHAVEDLRNDIAKLEF